MTKKQKHRSNVVKFHKDFKEKMVHIKEEILKIFESSSILDETWTLRDC